MYPSIDRRQSGGNPKAEGPTFQPSTEESNQKARPMLKIVRMGSLGTIEQVLRLVVFDFGRGGISVGIWDFGCYSSFRDLIRDPKTNDCRRECCPKDISGNAASVSKIGQHRA